MHVATRSSNKRKFETEELPDSQSSTMAGPSTASGYTSPSTSPTERKKRKRSPVLPEEAEAEADQADDEMSHKVLGPSKQSRRNPRRSTHKSSTTGKGSTVSIQPKPARTLPKRVRAAPDSDGGTEGNPAPRKRTRFSEATKNPINRTAPRRRSDPGPLITKAPEDIFGSSLSELSDSPAPSPPPNVQSTNPEIDEPIPDGAAAIYEDLVATTAASVVPLPTADSTHQNLEDVSKLLDLTTEMVSSLPEDVIKECSEDDDARSYMSDRSSVKAEAPDSLPSDVVVAPNEYWRSRQDSDFMMPPAPGMKDLDVFSQSQTQSSQPPTQSMGSASASAPSIASSQPGSSPRMPFVPFGNPSGALFATARVVPNTTKNAAHGAITFTDTQLMLPPWAGSPTALGPLPEEDYIPDSQPSPSV